MTVLEQLLEYQKVDADLRKIEQSVAGIEERKKFSQAKKFMESAREKLEAQDKRASELRRLRDDLVRRAEEIFFRKQLLYNGSQQDVAPYI